MGALPPARLPGEDGLEPGVQSAANIEALNRAESMVPAPTWATPFRSDTTV